MQQTPDSGSGVSRRRFAPRPGAADVRHPGAPARYARHPRAPPEIGRPRLRSGTQPWHPNLVCDDQAHARAVAPRSLEVNIRPDDTARFDTDTTAIAEFIWNTTSDTWWWSDPLFELYGYQPGSIEPTTQVFLSHKDPTDRARIDAVLDRCAAEGGPFSCYHHIFDTRGIRKTVVVVGEGNRDEDDPRSVCVQGYIVDVSDNTEADVKEAMSTALKNRAGIEQVKGALMLVYKLDADAAFNVLRGYSQVYNIKLNTIVAGALSSFEHRDASETVSRGDLDRLLWSVATSRSTATVAVD